MNRIPEHAEATAIIRGLDRSQAIIQFTADGEILDANPLFLKCMGYTIDEIRGRHHRMFVDAAYGESAEYSAFWEGLRSGEHSVAECRRLAKGGREVWI